GPARPPRAPERCRERGSSAGPPRSEEDHRAPAGSDAGTEELEGASTGDREPGLQDVGVFPHEGSVATTLEEEQDDVIDASVALLQGDPPLERLSVARPGLGLDSAAPALAPHERVPGTKVARDRQRDLGRPAEGAVEARPKPPEQVRVRGVTERRAGRVGA